RRDIVSTPSICDAFRDAQGPPLTILSHSTRGPRIVPRMDVRSLFGRLCLALVAIGLMLAAYQYAMRQAIHTVITSQPALRVLPSQPRLDFSGCSFSSGLYGAPSFGQPGYTSSTRCNFSASTAAPRPVPPPVAQMTKEESATASLWFMLAALALPLTLGGAM